MKKPYLDENEIKEFKERLQATIDLGAKHDMKFTILGNISSFNPLDVILALSTERLDKSSKRLNRLTWVLIALTVILAILTGISVWKLFSS